MKAIIIKGNDNLLMGPLCIHELQGSHGMNIILGHVVWQRSTSLLEAPGTLSSGFYILIFFCTCSLNKLLCQKKVNNLKHLPH
jgi:hypothetical protein